MCVIRLLCVVEQMKARSSSTSQGAALSRNIKTFWMNYSINTQKLAISRNILVYSTSTQINCLPEALTKHVHNTGTQAASFSFDFLFPIRRAYARIYSGSTYRPPESQNRCNRQDRYDNKQHLFIFLLRACFRTYIFLLDASEVGSKCSRIGAPSFASCVMRQRDTMQRLWSQAADVK